MKSPYKLLIIDDSQEILTVLTNFFTKKQFEVVSASNGLDALKHIDRKDAAFDLIITDLVLPNISGVAIISIVKKKFPQTPIIAITGWGEHPESLAREAHADVVLEKPFKLPEVEKWVNRLLSRDD
jgi:DNA-binding response OmpR family regulator